MGGGGGGGRIIKTVNTSAVHLLLKRGGGLHSKGAYFRVSTVVGYECVEGKTLKRKLSHIMLTPQW